MNALDSMVTNQHTIPPRTWLKSVGYTEAANINLFLYTSLPEISGKKVPTSVFRDSVVNAAAGTWPTVNESVGNIVDKLLPSAGTAGFHVTLETGPPPKPHVYRGGPERQANWNPGTWEHSPYGDDERTEWGGRPRHPEGHEDHN